MLELVCQYLHNWFDRGQLKWHGDVTLSDQGITVNGKEVTLKNGQYFRIVGSSLNDGVYKFPATGITAEDFTGAIWAMAVPPAVIALVSKIEEWQGKYQDVSLSPFSSESFDGYSYTKGATGDNGQMGATWQSAFANQLAPWRKLP